MTGMGLTQRQADLLAFITREVEAGRPAPSFDQMKVHMGLGSKSGIHRLLSALEERGHVRRMPNRARAIALVDGVAERAAPEPAEALEEPRIGISATVADHLHRYCARRRVTARYVLTAALLDWMERHP